MANKKIKQRVKIDGTRYDIQADINTIAGLNTILSSKMDKELTVGNFSAHNNYLPLAVLEEDGKYYLKANTNFKLDNSKTNYILTQAGTWKLDNSHNHDTVYSKLTHKHDSIYHSKQTLGVPRINLGNPLITEQALFDTQYNNKSEFHPISKYIIEKSTDGGTTWTDITTNYSETSRKRLVGGDLTSSIVFSPDVSATTTKIRFCFDATAYVFIGDLYMYLSPTRHPHTTKIIKKKDDSSSWEYHTNSELKTGGWPTHLHLPFSTIYWQNSTDAGKYRYIGVELEIYWNHNYDSATFSVYNIQFWGGYPAGKRTVYTVDENKHVIFPGLIFANDGTQKAVSLAGHNHSISEVTGLQAALDNKAASNHNHDTVYSKLTHNHDSSYAGIGHNHDTSYADISHNHSISEVTGLQAALDNKAASNHNHDSSYADISHTHDTSYADISHNHDSAYAGLAHQHGFITNDGTITQQVTDVNSAQIAIVNAGNKLLKGTNLVFNSTDSNYKQKYLSQYGTFENMPATYTPTAHPHGFITNDGTITQQVTDVNSAKIAIVNASNKLLKGTNLVFNSTNSNYKQKYLSQYGTFENIPTGGSTSGNWELLRTRSASSSLTSVNSGTTIGSVNLTKNISQGDVLAIELNSASSASYNPIVLTITIQRISTNPNSYNYDFNLESFTSWTGTELRVNNFSISASGTNLYFGNKKYIKGSFSGSTISWTTNQSYTLCVGRVWRLVQ